VIREYRVPRKRQPVDWREYAAHVRRAERKLGRRRHPLAATIAGSVVLAVAGSFFAQAVGVGIGAGVRDLGRSIVSTLPGDRNEDLVLGETPVTVSIAPILDSLPEFLKASVLLFEGRVPSFAVRAESSIAISLNGRILTTLQVAPDGRFGGIPITLQDGPNTIEATLLEGSTEIAATSHTVVVDRVAPELKIVRPEPGATVEGEVIVEGSTEAAADVTVNDRALRPNPDGTFTERIVAPPGPLALTIVARDRAGNETKTELTIIVGEAVVPTAGLVIAVSLDRALVKPGDTVVAEIHAIHDGQLKPDLAFTLQVGVITIGSYRTDASGTARVGFAAPNHEVEDVAVVILGGGTSARASFTVAK
jgi:hypothetical protein